MAVRVGSRRGPGHRARSIQAERRRAGDQRARCRSIATTRSLRTCSTSTSAGTVPQIRSPMRFTQAELVFERAAPLLGEHTEEVLSGLGFDEQRIAQWKNDGVI